MQGLGLDWDQTDIDSLWWSRSWSQNFCQGPDCPVSSLAKMAWDWTRPNFPNTSYAWGGTVGVGDDEAVRGARCKEGLLVQDYQ